MTQDGIYLSLLGPVVETGEKQLQQHTVVVLSIFLAQPSNSSSEHAQ